MRKQITGFGLLFLTFFFHSCSVNKATIDDSLKTIFEQHKSTGCFAFLNNASGEITVYNPSYDTARLSPGGSFHIPLALFALQKGTVADENQPFLDSASGLKCLSLSDAFINDEDSCFSYITQQMGKKEFQAFLDTLHYGNTKSGNDFSQCWNNGSLLISPDEQLGLMKKLYFNQLPFRESVHQSVCHLMKSENSNLYNLSWKISRPIKMVDGKFSSWCTGWIEENRHVYFFVTYVEAPKDDNNISAQITRQILTQYEFFQGKK